MEHAVSFAMVPPASIQKPSGKEFDMKLSSFLSLFYNKLEFLRPAQIEEINEKLRGMNITHVWNGLNGCLLQLPGKLSLDATPRNFYFINSHVPSPPSPRRPVSIEFYMKTRYGHQLVLPNSPVFRDAHGTKLPMETTWIRIKY